MSQLHFQTRAWFEATFLSFVFKQVAGAPVQAAEAARQNHEEEAAAEVRRKVTLND
jgi:hypothetical protein